VKRRPEIVTSTREQNVLEPKIRLIPGRRGWWLLAGGRAVLLPPEGVRTTLPGEASARGCDTERARCLTPAAMDALVTTGLVDAAEAPGTNYAVTVLTATNRNLGCDYCFQNISMAPAGSYAPPRIKTAVLGETEARSICDFVARQMRASQLTSTSMLLFGGEPLLNFAGCIAMLEGLRPLNLVDSEIVTNGVLLTPRKAQRLEDAGLRRVQITFDGARPAHDQVRVTRNGRPTYDAILKNVAAAIAVAPDLAWNFRVNVSHLNVDGLDDLVDDLAAVVDGARLVTLHLAMIDDTGLGYENNLGYDQSLAENFVAANRRAIAAGIRVMPSTSLRECPYCSVVGGSRGAVINADGALYSCWENAGRDGWAIGNVIDGYVDEATVNARWVACDFDIKPHGSPEVTRNFLDHIDAAALDDQMDMDRLQPALA
jgi:uncharacterized protein